MRFGHFTGNTDRSGESGRTPKVRQGYLLLHDNLCSMRPRQLTAP
jgi:hypothetical protein